jgi:hypothetical protein
MFKRNQIQKTLVLAGVTLASCAAFAQQNETTTASVTVQNAFTLTEVDALSFGTITAVRVSGAGASTLTLNPDGTAENPTGNIRVLAAGAPATYTVAGAASFTDLQMSLAADSIELSNSAAPGSNPTFDVDSFTVTNGTATAPITSGGYGTFTAGTAMTTDVNGAMTIGLGATLTLADGADASLIDGSYEGQFTLTVEY